MGAPASDSKSAEARADHRGGSEADHCSPLIVMTVATDAAGGPLLAEFESAVDVDDPAVHQPISRAMSDMQLRQAIERLRALVART